MIKIKDAVFSHAVRLQNRRQETFVTTDKTPFELFYKPEEQLMYVHHKDTGVIKLVGLTNIVEMTADISQDAKKSKKSE